jgi:hypothetical protein
LSVSSPLKTAGMISGWRACVRQLVASGTDASSVGGTLTMSAAAQPVVWITAAGQLALVV